MYSQNNEQQVILNYFKDFKGTLLDLGANDGKTFSNSLKLIELGWSADLVEASPKAFEKLEILHKNNEVKLHNVAIADFCGHVDFYDSGTLLNKEDSALVSTIDTNELKRFPKVEYNKIVVKAIDFKTLLEQTKNKTFNFITIDIEGVDWIVLKQMNLTNLEVKMLIIETNGVDNQKFIDYVSNFGLTLIAKNGENLIFAL